MKQFIRLMQKIIMSYSYRRAPERLDRENWLQSLEKNISYVADHKGMIVGLGIITMIVT